MAKHQITLLTPEQKQKYAQDIIDFFATQRDEQIGVIAAEMVLDFFLESVGNTVYNKGIQDAKDLLRNRLDELEINLDALKRSPN